MWDNRARLWVAYKPKNSYPFRNLAWRSDKYLHANQQIHGMQRTSNPSMKFETLKRRLKIIAG
jgi:hypothetical protein